MPPEARPQATLGQSVTLSGRGLFHGLPVQLTLRPAPENHGLVFRRVDLPGRPRVEACVSRVVPAPRRTVLSGGGRARVETTEHLLAALGGMGITNCLIDLTAIEVPAGDGSAMPFCEMILAAGTSRQSAPARVFTIAEPVAVAFEGDSQRIEATAGRDDGCSVSYRLEFSGRAPLADQFASFALNPETFLRQIAAARTFVFEQEIEALQARGFGRHLTAADLVVFDECGVPVDNGLRWPDEPVRHKILDCIGDLTLCGGQLNGHVFACRSGHALNHVMARVLRTRHWTETAIRQAA